MYTYFLFIINNNAYRIYKNNSNYLYEIMNTLYNLKEQDLVYGINLYKNICDLFNSKILNNYIRDRFNITINNDYITLNNKIEKTKIKINKSRIIISSNIKYPAIFRIFNIYNKKIFVIDFNNKKYFWLNEELNNQNNNI